MSSWDILSWPVGIFWTVGGGRGGGTGGTQEEHGVREHKKPNTTQEPKTKIEFVNVACMFWLQVLVYIWNENVIKLASIGQSFLWFPSQFFNIFLRNFGRVLHLHFWREIKKKLFITDECPHLSFRWPMATSRCKTNIFFKSLCVLFLKTSFSVFFFKGTIFSWAASPPYKWGGKAKHEWVRYRGMAVLLTWWNTLMQTFCQK